VHFPGFDVSNAVCLPEFTLVDLDYYVAEKERSDAATEVMQSLPATYWELSPSGKGLHCIFHSAGNLCVTKRAGSVVEAYSEKHFMSCTGWAIYDAPIATLRPKDVERFSAKKTALRAAADVATDTATIIATGERTKTLLSIAGTMRRRGLSMDAIEAAIRTHNTEHCQPPLDDKKIRSLLKSVTKYKAAAALLTQERHDAGNADRLRLYGEGDFRYVPAYKRWVVYDGVRWPVEDREQEDIRAQAHAMIREYGAQASEAENQDHMKFAAASLDSSRISSLLREAQPHATLRIAELDREPLLVNFQNGTLDARTGKMRPHSREDFITAVIAHDYKPKAECRTWMKFINHTFGGDQPLIDFVQRALGYSLTGATSEKCLFLAYGPTDTGKTTLLTTVSKLLGGYAGRIKVESLMVERGRSLDNNAQSDLADLRGKRFVNTSETGQGQQLREALIKVLSQGQGNYKAVRKYENPFDFPETWKIWMDCNHLPGVRDTDDSIWQRLHVVPFQNPVKKKNSNLAIELLKEAEGILAWMVVGLKAWEKDGLLVPAVVTEQRQEWQAESDTLKQWLEEDCVLRDDAKTASGALFESYALWRAAHGFYKESMVLFARNMKEHGYQKKEEGDKKVPTWQGVGLIAE
jgi:putative DNA primase/helicase